MCYSLNLRLWFILCTLIRQRSFGRTLYSALQIGYWRLEGQATNFKCVKPHLSLSRVESEWCDRNAIDKENARISEYCRGSVEVRAGAYFNRMDVFRVSWVVRTLTRTIHEVVERQNNTICCICYAATTGLATVAAVGSATVSGFDRRQLTGVRLRALASETRRKLAAACPA